jgi:hypothetical protein
MDADNLIDGVAISSLESNTVYYTDGIKNTWQLKPYIMPSCDELEHFMSKLN